METNIYPLCISNLMSVTQSWTDYSRFILCRGQLLLGHIRSVLASSLCLEQSDGESLSWLG